MALSGLEIYKHLPKTNCKDCKVPTCLAFAMKVAAGQAALTDCPHVKPEALAALSEASAPPQQIVKIGAGDKAIEIGQETVLFRHEEKFQRPAAVAVRVKDDDKALLEARCRKIAGFKLERMRKPLAVDLVAVENVSGDAGKFTEAAKAASAAAGRPVVLMSKNAAALKAAGEALKDGRPLLWAQAGSGGDAIAVAKELSLPLVLEAGTVEEVTALSEKARGAGLKELVLSPGPVDVVAGLQFLTHTRRAALQKKFRPLGYPVAMTSLGDDLKAVVDACAYVLKYAGVLVVDVTEPHHLVGILTSRQDIYTNPQVPVQVEPGLHTIGTPGADAPVLVTTNFALSYYSVESEVEASRVPAHIVAVNTEGTSVLTAWASDKFNAKTIAATVKGSGVEGKVSHKKLVLPGLVAVLRAGVEDETGRQVEIGPREASGLVSYLKNTWKP